MFALSSLRIFSNGVFMMLGVKMKSLASVVFTLKKKKSWDLRLTG